MNDYRGKTILIVEDEALIAMSGAQLLEAHGFNVITAGTGKDAILAVQENPGIDLVLMDIDLGPGMDGTEAAAQILRGHDIPVLFLSSHTNREMVEKTEKITSYGYVVKNSGDVVLMASIKMAFKLYYAHRSLKGTLCELADSRKETDSRDDTLCSTNQILAAILEHTPMMAVYLDTHFNFIWVNNAYADTCRHEPSFFPGKNHFDLYPHEENQAIFQHVVDTGMPYFVEAKPFQFPDQPERGVTYWDWSLYPVRDPEGNTEGLVFTLTEVTGRVRAEVALKESEALVQRKLNAILEPDSALEAIELQDLLNAEEFQSLMDDFYHLAGVGLGILNLQGKVLVATGWQDICTGFHRVNPDTRKYCEESDRELSKGLEPGSYRQYRCRNNMWDISTPIMVGEMHLGNIFLGQFLYDDETPDYELFRSQARAHHFDEQEYINALNRVPRWSREKVETAMRFYTKLAGIIASLSYSSIRLARALTRQEKLMNDLALSEEHYRVLTESMKDVVWVLDPETFRFTYVSPSVEKLRGYTAEEIMAVSATEALTDEAAEKVKALTKEYINQYLSGRMPPGTYLINEIEQPCKDGTTVWTEAITSYHMNPRTGSVVVRGVTRDISPRREAQEALKKALHDKDIMFRELQHRVKNSFHMILSLISLEQGRATDPLAISLLTDLAGRVNSLTRLYAMLYQSGGISEIFLDEYLDQVAVSLMQTYAAGKSLFRIERRLERVTVDMKKAAPLGLILNELLTNAFKYAFPDRRDGTVMVELKKRDQEIELAVSDDGVGTPQGFDTARSPGFGMLLIRMLVKQLGGSLIHEKNEGTTFQVKVPIAPNEEERKEL